MEFSSAEDLSSFLQNNIKTSYKQRYVGTPELTPKQGMAMRRLKFRTDQRAALHDSMLELLKYSGVRFRSHIVRGEQSNLEVIDITTADDKVRILIKPKAGREWRQQNYWNERLETLSNWRDLKGSPDTQIEYDILKYINIKIDEYGMKKPVELRIKSKRYKNIIGFVPGPTGAKADFVGINSDGQSVLFISHKAGFNSKDFQQYSGLSSRAGGSIYDHPEVQEFRKDIASKETSDFYRNAYYREIKDRTLKNRAVFGKDYGSGPKNANNIDIFGQGRVVVTRTSPGTVTLSFATKLAESTQLSQLERAGYTPTLGARKGEAYRTVEYLSDRVNGVRAGIFSKEYIEGRNSEPI